MAAPVQHAFIARDRDGILWLYDQDGACVVWSAEEVRRRGRDIRAEMKGTP